MSKMKVDYHEQTDKKSKKDEKIRMKDEKKEKKKLGSWQINKQQRMKERPTYSLRLKRKRQRQKKWRTPENLDRPCLASKGELWEKCNIVIQCKLDSHTPPTTEIQLL